MRVQGVRYDHDSAGMSRWLMSGYTASSMRALANRVAVEASSNIYRAGAVDTGEAARSYRVESSVGGQRAEGGPRRSATVSSNDPGAIALEFGYRQMSPALAPLRRAAYAYNVPRARRSA